MNAGMDEFIEEVRLRPAIYDITLPEYSDRAYKKYLWTQICEKFTPNWSRMSEDNRDIIGREMKNRWKSIRDAFVREVRYLKDAERNGEPIMKKRKYLYYDQLSFLLPTIGARAMRSHYSNSNYDSIISNYDNSNFLFSDLIKKDCDNDNLLVKDNCKINHNKETDDDDEIAKTRRKNKKRLLQKINNSIIIKADDIHAINNELPIMNNSFSLINNNNNNNNNENLKNNEDGNSKNVSITGEEERLQITPSIEDMVQPCDIIVNNNSNSSTSSSINYESNYNNSLSIDYNSSDNNGRNYESISLFKSPDPDFLFLMSLVPSFKKLNEEQKSSIKIKISSVIHEALYGKTKT